MVKGWVRAMGLAAVAGLVAAAATGAEPVAWRWLPWPPEGWLPGRGGELRVVIPGTDGPPEVLLRTPVDAQGRAVLDLQAAAAPAAERQRAFDDVLLSLVEASRHCAQVELAWTPPDARAAVGELRAYSGEGAGYYPIETELPEARGDREALEVSGPVTLWYIDRPVRAWGQLQCRVPDLAGMGFDSITLVVDLDFDAAGWQWMAVSIRASLTGATGRLVVAAPEQVRLRPKALRWGP